MGKYYTEKIEKDTRYRKEYGKSIADFLEQEKEKATKRRFAFFTPERCKVEQEKYRQQFAEMLGFPLSLERVTPNLLEKQFVAQDGNINIYRMQFLFWDTVKVYAMYFEQLNADRDTPFVVGLHGGEGTPELVSSIHLDSANYNHLVRRITDMGANVLVPQLLLWSKNNYGGEYDRIYTDGKLRQLGGSITALELYFLRGLIDCFLENERVNHDKIGVCGMSYGGMYALHLAAIDTRIKACYSCSWVCDGFVNSWADWSYKNAQNTFAVAETAGLVAPRALVVAMGDKDELFDSRLTEKECARIEKIYGVFDAKENFLSRIFDGVHEFDKGNTEFEFFFNKLRCNNEDFAKTCGKTKRCFFG